MINRLKNSKAGFTLIELMIVVAIVGILSAIAIPNYLSYRTKGQDAAAKSDARSYYTTALAYFADVPGATTFDGTNLPPGFSKNPDVDYTATLGNGFAIDTDNLITSDMEFSHAGSGHTYGLSNEGVISLQP